MHSLLQLEKQQVGLRLPKYLLDEIDTFTKTYALNRSEIIVEAIKSYVSEQKLKLLYNEFDTSVKELKIVVNDKIKSDKLQTLDELVNELENS